MVIKCKNTFVESLSLNSQESLTFADFTNLVHNNMLSLVEQNAVGHLKNILQSHLGVRGKKIRSKVVFELGTHLQAPYSQLVELATSSELLHEATLIHDDIQDEDELRRGKHTFWKANGLSHAINAGDFLLMLSLKPLMNLQNQKLLKLHTDTSFKLAQGQAEEIYNKENGQFSNQNFYHSCIEQKTASLFSCLAESVGVLAKIDKKNIEDIKNLFLKIGCLFQMQDDLLDLYGNKQRESVGCDIKEGKVSFLIHTHLKNHPKDMDLIKNILTKPKTETSELDIMSLKVLFEKKDTVKKTVQSLIDEAQNCIKMAEDHLLFNKNPLFVKNIISLILKPIEHLFNANANRNI